MRASLAHMNNEQGLGFRMSSKVVSLSYLVKISALLCGTGSTIVTLILGVNAVTREIEELSNSTDALLVSAGGV